MKANHLVMAIHDHFTQKSVSALKQIHDIATAHETDAEKIHDITQITNNMGGTALEDAWALEYITLQRVCGVV